MKVSVIICTYNRAIRLGETLRQFEMLRIPKHVSWELIVVDNNSSDMTQTVLKDFSDRLPLVSLFESNIGHSKARNLAINQSRGSLLLWTDDDVEVDSEWLATYCDAAKSWESAGFFGGKIEPKFESQAPQWLLNHLELFRGMLVIRDYGEPERFFKRNETPFGANMAIRRWVVDKFHFNPELGLSGSMQIRDDETRFFRELEEANIHGVWVPKSRVLHFISDDRLSPNYVWNWFYGAGQGQVRQANDADTSFDSGERNLLIAYHSLLWRFLRLKAWWYRILGNHDWVTPYTIAASICGNLDEIRNLKSKTV